MTLVDLSIFSTENLKANLIKLKKEKCFTDRTIINSNRKGFDENEKAYSDSV